MVMQERVYFRNIPMSNWTEREMVIEEAGQNGLSPRPEQLESPAMVASVPRVGPQRVAPQMNPQVVQTVPAGPSRVTISKVLEPVAVPVAPAVAQRREPRVLAAVNAGFGAQ
jgi:hypothetical protein